MISCSRKIAILMSILIILSSLPLTVLAADRTDVVSAAASFLESWNHSIGIYDTAARDAEENLCTIRINFRTTDLTSVYEQFGDTVDIFIKSSRDAETGWIDLDGNGDYNKSTETLDGKKMGTLNGMYIENARINRNNSISLHVGSTLPGKFTIQIFLASGARPEKRIGDPVTIEVKGGEGEVTLQAFNEAGTATLSGHSGKATDPYRIEAGEGIELRAYVKDGTQYLRDRVVTFRESINNGSYKDIGTAITDEEGMAYIMTYGEEAGLHSFQAVITEDESPELFVEYFASDIHDIVPKTPTGKVVALGELYKVEFNAIDRYKNPVGAGTNNIKFIIDGPPGSSYEDYPLVESSTNAEGVASLVISPDRSGDYKVKCTSVDGRGAGQITFRAVPFGKPTSLKLELKASNGSSVPAVRYTDANNDGIPESAGTLQVILVNSQGAEVLASGRTLQPLSFNTSNAAEVAINDLGQITVLNKNFIGQVMLTVLDEENKISGTYNLQVSGTPAYLKYTVTSNGKKADVSLQYVDKNINVTYAKAGEEYNVSFSEKGIGVSNIKPFDNNGKASFMLTAEEYKSYRVTVATKTYNVAVAFDVKFTQDGISVKGARNVIMFIGQKSYIQDGVAKSTDVAPFIKDGRTFVAVRPLGEAFGATVDWDPINQVITLSRTDLILKITIGSNTIVKTADGLTSTLHADVPAFITAEGRTVLPFRAVGEAFSVNVNYDASTSAVSYAQ